MAGGPVKQCLTWSCKGLCAIGVLLGVIGIIMVLTSIKSLGPEDQLLIFYLDGKAVLNGPMTKVVNPLRAKEWRKAHRLTPSQYIRITDSLSGQKRVEEGPKLVFLGAYETADPKRNKIVLKGDQYIKLVDRLTGTERVLSGPRTVVPGPWEESARGRQQAKLVNRDSAVVVLNKADGTQRLHTTPGVFIPNAYETVLQESPLIRVLPHEALVVRDRYGRLLIYSGAGGDATGTSFFLGPYDKLVKMHWSVFSSPSDASPMQTITKEEVSVVDMRVRKVEFQYEVRTSDNVGLRLQGVIFWKVVDVGRTINVTDDPVGDVWHRARSALAQAVSRADLDTFTKSFNSLVQASYRQQAADGFYGERGVQMQSIDVTRYECVDQQTAATLQDIIKETTDRINRLQAQRSVDDVQFAKLQADIQLEVQRTQLIQTQAYNELLAARKAGEAKGAALAKSAASFLDGLNASLPSIEQRVELYKLHKRLEHQNEKTQAIAWNRTTLFLTPQDMDLQFDPLEP